mmetsp:Transcript_19491/g.28890  ORF Transcript_19491/g.28890 Transcript_19491/m.28890 type:complete len:317 (-) Transcript_19491:153-1103(-)|eukprot:CAMPEP_0194199824 /NCGR_PEP_ID=MMETSP0156-20130528/687_1 /TAXON_ID=33649 /ORGANISM="Thalassionema nitzschioides, Strain L26-B" /LENGTH=316 /DNA_ID=CAMNT_0038924763 /DNA_START=89 /DNA_END=1039 /DNA_ORIENTATION=-
MPIKTKTTAVTTGKATSMKNKQARVRVSRLKFQHGIHDRVLNHLNSGQPILLPMPSPLPYIVVARDRETVNGVKGRPAETSLCKLIGSFDQIEDFVALDEKGRDAAKRHLTDERMTVLVPIAAWMVEDSASQLSRDVAASHSDKFKQPSDTIRSDRLKMDLVRRPSAEFGNPYALFHHPVATRNKPEFCSKENHLYASSGNVSGQPFGQTFDTICQQFERYGTPDKNYHLLALDADHLRMEGMFHESTSMVRVTERGNVKTTREGIHHHHMKTKCWRMKQDDIEVWEQCLAKPTVTKPAAKPTVLDEVGEDDGIWC